MGTLEQQSFESRYSGRRRAQSVVEFAFGMVIFGLMVYGLVQCFRWVVMDLAERRFDHDRILVNESLSTEAQLNPNFHRVRRIDAVLPSKN
jgi:hypothetical protein